MRELLAGHLAAWGLTPVGPVRRRPASLLVDVVLGSRPAVLKLALDDEERRGGELMQWWAGAGAAEVIARSGPALLIERATGARSLASMARGSQDDEASRIACRVVAKLHSGARQPTRWPPGLPALDRWFAALWPAAATHGGILADGAEAARRLLADQREVVVLHGDVHHGNVLDFEERGWLAIDPKGVVGDRAFDYANLLCNPDHQTALAPGRFERQVEVIASAAELDRRRLLGWTLAYCSLSAAWFLEDGDGHAASGPGPDTALAVARLAAAAAV